jgi:hypothetical protein
MKSLDEILEKLKIIIEDSVPDGVKVKDKDVALALGITQNRLATLKKRKKIPYKEIMDLCVDRDILIESFFYSNSLGRRYSLKCYNMDNVSKNK